MLELTKTKEIDIVELANKLHDLIQCRSIIIEEPMLTFDYYDTHTIVTTSYENISIENVDGKERMVVNTCFRSPIKLPVKVTDKDGTHRDQWHICHRFDFY